MTLGTEVDADALGPVPANVHVERWVPQAAVMPEAAAMVGHGGSASTLAAMAAGVPLVSVPLYADQPVNAARVAALGAGIALDGVDGLADAVRAVLGDPLYRDGARASRARSPARAGRRHAVVPATATDTARRLAFGRRSPSVLSPPPARTRLAAK